MDGADVVMLSVHNEKGTRQTRTDGGAGDGDGTWRFRPLVAAVVACVSAQAGHLGKGGCWWPDGWLVRVMGQTDMASQRAQAGGAAEGWTGQDSDICAEKSLWGPADEVGRQAVWADREAKRAELRCTDQVMSM